MSWVTAGTDTYGKVKKVGATTVVTKFAMLSALPLWPVQSYFYLGAGETRSEGIPFICWSTSTAIRGIPLARIDRLSVVMAYFRAAFGGMMVFGSFVIVALILESSGQHADSIAIAATHFLLGLFCVGVVGGLLTYCLPFQLTPRERRIRQECEEILGICADPALIQEDSARAILSALRDHTASENADPFATAPAVVETHDTRIQLARVRAMIALGHPRDPLELRTDELLAEIQRTTDRDAIYHDRPGG